LTSSCSKEKGAEEDDGCCDGYCGGVVFWFNKATSDSLLEDGATSLTYYVDDTIVGSSATSVYWTGAPDCGQEGSVTVIKKLGSVKSKSFTYSIKDQRGHEYWKGTVEFKANTCSAEQLTF